MAATLTLTHTLTVGTWNGGRSWRVEPLRFNETSFSMNFMIL